MGFLRRLLHLKSTAKAKISDISKILKMENTLEETELDQKKMARLPERNGQNS
jgi:hypothetical protein